MTDLKVSEKKNIVFKGSTVHVNKNQNDYLDDFWPTHNFRTSQNFWKNLQKISNFGICFGPNWISRQKLNHQVSLRNF